MHRCRDLTIALVTGAAAADLDRSTAPSLAQGGGPAESSIGHFPIELAGEDNASGP